MSEDFWKFVVSTFAFGVIAFMMGNGIGTCRERHKAMDANVARWIIDSKTGEKSFEYGVKTEAK